MKKAPALLTAFILVVSLANAQQWTTSSTHIYSALAGNVGVGTGAAPAAFKFEVMGSGTANGQIVRNTLSTGYTSLRLYNNQNLNTRALEIDYAGSSYATAVLSGGPTGEAASISTTGAYPLMFGTSNAMRMIINSSGNVGIGTNAPATKFEVSGGNFRLTTNTSSLLQLGAFNSSSDNFGYISSSGQSNGTGLKFQTTNGSGSSAAADRMIITNDGIVGIGTTAPAAGIKLEVNGIFRVTSNNSSYLQVGSFNTSTDNFGYVSSAGQANGTGLKFETTNGSGGSTRTTRMTILNSGYIGIGTMSPDEMLTVNGKIHVKEVKIDLSIPTPDYVFEKDYKLLTLDEVRAYIAKHNHLPDVPSAAEMERDGVNVSEMNMILLRKVEELTLYVMQLEEKVNMLQSKR